MVFWEKMGSLTELLTHLKLILFLYHSQASQSLRFQKRPLEVFYKKSVPRNFSKFTGKHLRQSLFLNKVAGLRPKTLAQVFCCEYCKYFKNTLFTEHLQTTASDVL